MVGYFGNIANPTSAHRFHTYSRTTAGVSISSPEEGLEFESDALSFAGLVSKHEAQGKFVQLDEGLLRFSELQQTLGERELVGGDILSEQNYAAPIIIDAR